ncbi:hypothetical protein [Bdellovibrio sp. HCB2-146]|uniref:hypothetical protein n=1 Tax=Bdellovibrio sp. HCB2-146 TaxID=3394362 RepID=UPI0039BCD038
MRTLQNVKATYMEGGLRGLRARYGWRIFAAIFCYYLIRDTLLYIVIPLFGVKALFASFDLLRVLFQLSL